MKKVFGYLFLGIAGFLGLSTLIQIPSFFEGTSQDASIGTAYSIGFIMGKIVALLITIAVVVLLIWLGRKWIKKDKVVTETQPKKSK